MSAFTRLPGVWARSQAQLCHRAHPRGFAKGARRKNFDFSPRRAFVALTRRNKRDLVAATELFKKSLAQDDFSFCKYDLNRLLDELHNFNYYLRRTKPADPEMIEACSTLFQCVQTALWSRKVSNYQEADEVRHLALSLFKTWCSFNLITLKASEAMECCIDNCIDAIEPVLSNPKNKTAQAFAAAAATVLHGELSDKRARVSPRSLEKISNVVDDMKRANPDVHWEPYYFSTDALSLALDVASMRQMRSRLIQRVDALQGLLYTDRETGSRPSSPIGTLDTSRAFNVTNKDRTAQSRDSAHPRSGVGARSHRRPKRNRTVSAEWGSDSQRDSNSGSGSGSRVRTKTTIKTKPTPEPTEADVE
ncbi:MAG: hypothetical protein MHM6MM_006378 [Cercozoa sp. M6MM]